MPQKMTNVTAAFEEKMDNRLLNKRIVLKSRCFFDIIAEMVTVCKVGARKTHIMYKANLSYEMLQRYLKTLVDANLVEMDPDRGLYRASPKGLSFVRDYEDFKNLDEIYKCKKNSLLEVVVRPQEPKHETVSD